MDSSSELLTTLGRRVRTARIEHDWTLADLAERSGLSRRFLSDLEAGRGNISVARLFAVGQALDLPLERLLAEEETTEGVHGLRRRLLTELETLDEVDLREACDWLRTRYASHEGYDKFALIGLRGAGKTSIGRRIAERLGLPFVELDQRVEHAAGMNLSDIFSIHGEEYYRRLEREALSTIVSGPGGVVIAASGGIVNDADAYSLLRSACYTIWLRAAPEHHWGRVVAQGDRRPMRGKPQAMAELRALLETRRELYARAHHQVDTSALGFDGAVEAVYEAIAQAG
jgi:XRE family aerobic/anaerobic benzoate catabolism transcriptional regulator